MICIIASLVLIYIFYLLILLSGRFYKPRSSGNELDPSEITVLLPFRDEAENLPNLLAQIKKFKSLPKKFIFINDHSSDDSVELISNTAISNLKLIYNNEGEHGKKAALRKGISGVQTKYFLTWDADILPPENYFQCLKKHREADLIILPVEIKAGGLFASLWETESRLLSQLNLAAAYLKRPILASGANLLVRKSAYQEVNNSDHAHIASGDDMFLLRDMLRNKKEINIVSDEGLKVITKAPKGIQANLDQRARWISKNGYLKDHFANLLGFMGIFSILASQTLLVLLILFFPWPVLLSAIVLKYTSELLLFYRDEKKGANFLTPFSLNIYPYLGLLIFIYAKIRTPLWKGRLANIQHKR